VYRRKALPDNQPHRPTAVLRLLDGQSLRADPAEAMDA
jgi:hypothetical protein